MYLGNGTSAYATGAATLPKCTDSEFAAAIKQIHSVSVSIHMLQAEYDRTGDKRFLDSIESLIPHYKNWMNKANSLAQCLEDREMPSSFMMELANLGDWLRERGRNITNVFEGLTNPIVLLGIGALALFFAFGRK